MGEKANFKEQDYKDAAGAWPYLAADRNGYSRALTEVRSLITIVEDDHV